MDHRRTFIAGNFCRQFQIDFGISGDNTNEQAVFISAQYQCFKYLGDIFSQLFRHMGGCQIIFRLLHKVPASSADLCFIEQTGVTAGLVYFRRHISYTVFSSEPSKNPFPISSPFVQDLPVRTDNHKFRDPVKTIRSDQSSFSLKITQLYILSDPG